MACDVLIIESPGLGASLQDLGHPGWRRFGVPPGGAMDDHAATYANRLLDNPPEAPVLELLLQGAALRFLRNTWIAIAGAQSHSSIEPWRAVQVTRDTVLRFPQNQSGVWTYLAVEGGFIPHGNHPHSGLHPRDLIGSPLAPDAVLQQKFAAHFELPSGVAGRSVAWDEKRHYDSPPVFRLWPGPQWDLFASEDHARMFQTPWTVTAQSNRVGYRFEGGPLEATPRQIISEPVRLGTVQVPESGCPIVTMRDGPTVGGYPKIGVLDPAQISWLAQCRPGQSVRFQPAK
jgi:biotin-dependent carboxylase-like uncharacterized protein